MLETPVHTLQASFARGEVSPYLFGRVDLAAYQASLRTLRNCIVRPEGPASNRQGFGYIGNSLSRTPKASILVPFIFSATQSYVIEIGALSAQVFSAGALVNGLGAAISNITVVFDSGSLSYITNVFTATPHGLVAHNNVAIAGVIGTGAFNINGSWTVATAPSNTQFTIFTGQGNAGAYTSGGNILVPFFFATPWAAADLPLLRWSQSSDTLTLVHPNYPPYEIKRTSANSFTCLAAVYVNGPFLPQNTDGTTFVFASAITGTVTLTASSPIFNANQVGGLMQLTQQDLSLIPPWEPSKLFTDISGGHVTPVGLYRRASLKNYKCVSIGNTSLPANGVASGTWIPSHSQGTQTDGDGSTIPNLAAICGVSWQYQDSGFGTVLITGFTSSTQVTAVVQPNYVGGPSLLPLACVGGPITVFGPFSFTATAGQTAFTPLTGATSTDPTKFFVTVNGVYQAPSSYSVAGTTLTFLGGQALGATVVIRQITQLGQTTYWTFGAFSVDQGYPSAVTYFPDRLVLAATPKQPVGVFGSKTSQYHDYGVSTPVVASDAFSIFLNARQLNAISDLIPLSDLLIGTSNIIWRLWPGVQGTALSPLAIAANPQSYYGENPGCASVLYGDSAIFAEFDGRRVRDLIYQFAYDKFLGQELTLYSRHLIPFGTKLTRMAYMPDPAGQMLLSLRSDGQLLACTYLREQQVTGWAHWDTQGTFEDVCVVPENSAFAVYVITNRTVQGATQRYIERQSQREVKTIFDYKFLDCGLTYDGRNTSSTTMVFTGGSTFLAGDTGLLTASGTSGWAAFLPTDVGNEIWLYGTLNFTTSVGSLAAGVLTAAVTPGTYILNFPDGETRAVTVAVDGITCAWQNVLNSGAFTSATYRCRLLLTAFSSGTQFAVRLKDQMPAGLRGIATVVWTFARTTFGGAQQIAGLPAVALVDACVYGINATGITPNGNLIVGNDGSVTLQSAGGVVQVGLPYLSDFETLSLNEQGQDTIRMRAKTNPVIYLDVTECRNFLAGTDFSTLSPNTERAFEPYTAATNMQQGILWARVASELGSECHTCIRQNMPLPMTIRMHIPQVTIGEPVA